MSNETDDECSGFRIEAVDVGEFRVTSLARIGNGIHEGHILPIDPEPAKHDENVQKIVDAIKLVRQKEAQAKFDEDIRAAIDRLDEEKQ